MGLARGGCGQEPELVPARLLEDGDELVPAWEPGGGVDGPGTAGVVGGGVDGYGCLRGAGCGVEGQDEEAAGEVGAGALGVEDGCAVGGPGGLGVEAVGGDGVAVVWGVGAGCWWKGVGAGVDLGGGEGELGCAVGANGVELVEAIAAGLEEDPVAARVPERVVVRGTARIAGTGGVAEPEPSAGAIQTSPSLMKAICRESGDQLGSELGAEEPVSVRTGVEVLAAGRRRIFPWSMVAKVRPSGERRPVCGGLVLSRSSMVRCCWARMAAAGRSSRSRKEIRRAIDPPQG